MDFHCAPSAADHLHSCNISGFAVDVSENQLMLRFHMGELWNNGLMMCVRDVKTETNENRYRTERFSTLNFFDNFFSSFHQDPIGHQQHLRLQKVQNHTRSPSTMMISSISRLSTTKQSSKSLICWLKRFVMPSSDICLHALKCCYHASFSIESESKC